MAKVSKYNFGTNMVKTKRGGIIYTSLFLVCFIFTMFLECFTFTGCSGDYQLSDSTTSSGHIIRITNKATSLRYNSGVYTVYMNYTIKNSNSGYIKCVIYDVNDIRQDSVSYSGLKGSGTKSWGIKTDQTGHFELYAHLVVDADKEISRDCMFYVIEGDTSPVQPRTLTVWSGDSAKGCSGDRLTWPVAHQLIVQATGFNSGDSVFFKADTSAGSFWGGYSIDGFSYVKSTVISQNLPNLGAVNLATAQFGIKKQPPTNGCSQIYVTCEAANATSAYYTLFSLDDKEQSHIKAPYDTCTHQKKDDLSGIEVVGDNYILKPDGSYESGLAAANKNVYIELDYADVNGVLADSIIDIAYYIDSVLATAGIEAETRYDDCIPTMPAALDRKQRQGMLKDYRNYKGTQNSFIHVILGTLPSDAIAGADEWFGITENYVGFGEIANPWESVHFGSGPGAQAHKDSVGCFVFATRILDMPRDSVKMGWVRAIAYVAVHEIGHALGMNHYSYNYSKNVMFSMLTDAFIDSYGWENYGKFEPKSLDGKNDADNATWDGMNTKHVLGIDCVLSKENY